MFIASSKFFCVHVRVTHTSDFRKIVFHNSAYELENQVHPGSSGCFLSFSLSLSPSSSLCISAPSFLSLQVGFLYNFALFVIGLSASLCIMRQSFSSHYYWVICYFFQNLIGPASLFKEEHIVAKSTLPMSGAFSCSTLLALGTGKIYPCVL